MIQMFLLHSLSCISFQNMAAALEDMKLFKLTHPHDPWPYRYGIKAHTHTETYYVIFCVLHIHIVTHKKYI